MQTSFWVNKIAQYTTRGMKLQTSHSNRTLWDFPRFGHKNCNSLPWIIFCWNKEYAVTCIGYLVKVIYQPISTPDSYFFNFVASCDCRINWEVVDPKIKMIPQLQIPLSCKSTLTHSILSRWHESMSHKFLTFLERSFHRHPQTCSSMLSVWTKEHLLMTTSHHLDCTFSFIIVNIISEEERLIAQCIASLFFIVLIVVDWPPALRSDRASLPEVSLRTSLSSAPVVCVLFEPTKEDGFLTNGAEHARTSNNGCLLWVLQGMWESLMNYCDSFRCMGWMMTKWTQTLVPNRNQHVIKYNKS